MESGRTGCALSDIVVDGYEQPTDKRITHLTALRHDYRRQRGFSEPVMVFWRTVEPRHAGLDECVQAGGEGYPSMISTALILSPGSGSRSGSRWRSASMFSRPASTLPKAV